MTANLPATMPYARMPHMANRKTATGEHKPDWFQLRVMAAFQRSGLTEYAVCRRTRDIDPQGKGVHMDCGRNFLRGKAGLHTAKLWMILDVLGLDMVEKTAKSVRNST